MHSGGLQAMHGLLKDVRPTPGHRQPEHRRHAAPASDKVITAVPGGADNDTVAAALAQMAHGPLEQVQRQVGAVRAQKDSRFPARKSQHALHSLTERALALPH